MAYSTIHITVAGRKPAMGPNENQDQVLDRMISLEKGEALAYLIGVADGISQSHYGGSVARFLVKQHLATDPIFESVDQSVGDVLEGYLRWLKVRFETEFAGFEDMLASASTLSVAVAHQDVAECFWVGDSPIFYSKFIANRFATVQISSPDFRDRVLTDCFGNYAPFRLKRKSVPMEVGDILTIASDGAKCDADALSHLYSAMGFNQASLQTVAESAMRSRFYDDITVVAAKRLS